MFDRYVSGSQPSWKRRAVLVASLAAHGLLGLGLLVAGLFHVTEISPPALAIVFMRAHEPPPEGDKQQQRRQHQQQQRKRAATTSARPIVQPTSPTVQPTPQVAPPPSEPSPPSENVGPGGGDGTTSSDGGPGVPGGGGDGTGGNGIGMREPRARNVAPHQLDAQKITGADPHLPEFVKIARRGLGDNAFTARICVDQAGSVSRVDVLSGIPGADEAIVAALRGWRYRAQPIPVCFVSRFVFDVQ